MSYDYEAIKRNVRIWVLERAAEKPGYFLLGSVVVAVAPTKQHHSNVSARFHKMKIRGLVQKALVELSTKERLVQTRQRAEDPYRAYESIDKIFRTRIDKEEAAKILKGIKS